MKAVLQRVSQAKVECEGRIVAAIGAGILILLGVAKGDGKRECEILAGKIAALRIFEDDAGKLNRSVKDTGGEALIVSNFTLCGSCRRGTRPDFSHAAAYFDANKVYNCFTEAIKETGIRCECGVFGGDMKVSLVNDGPVTVIIDTDEF